MSSKRLLILDDEPEFGQFVRNVANVLDFEVKVTTRPTQFMEVYEAFDSMVIVLDVVMPETDGIEIVKSIQAALPGQVGHRHRLYAALRRNGKPTGRRLGHDLRENLLQAGRIGQTLCGANVSFST